MNVGVTNHASLKEKLEEIDDSLEKCPRKAINELVRLLNVFLDSASEQKRIEVIQSIRSHNLHRRLLEDPYTRRAYQRPRGYAGDAALIDFFYGFNFPEPDTTALGLSLFGVNMEYPTVDSVRYRRSLIAHLVDDLASKADKPIRVASIACGHLREIAFSRAVSSGRVADYLGLDQDERSLEVVEAAYGELGVTVAKENILKIAAGGLPSGDWDFIYAAGLFDYLNEKVAKKLTAAMVQGLRANGRVIIANVMPSIIERGYMEAVMNWQLIYRENIVLCNIVRNACANIDVIVDGFADPMGSFSYCLVRKVG